MKKIFLGMVLAGACLYGHGEVILTGIMDGTLTGGKPKAIELFIAGTEDLGGYEIWRSQNGDPFGYGSGSISALNGTYSNTFVYLVKSDHVVEFHSVFGDTGIYANVIPLGIVSGNGNEGYQIRDTVGGVVVDQVWLEDPTYSYLDSYWYRDNGTGPDGTWLAEQWSTPGNDVLDGLDEAGLRAAVPFGSYALVWNGISSDWNDSLNWMPSMTPGQHCNVFIPDTVAFNPVITNLPASPATCFHLTVGAGASVTVAAGKALTVFGDLTVNGTQTSSRFILASDSTMAPTGSLLLRGAAVDSITVKRYIPHDNSWHFLSSPVQGQSVQPEFAPDPLDNTFDLYCWQEAVPLTEGWMNIRDVGGNLNPAFDTEFIQGKGYLVAYSGLYGGTTMKSFTGIPHHGSIILLSTGNNNHWNLMGNPYSCALDWSSPGINKTVMTGGAMYIWDQGLNGGAGAYRSHNGTTGVPAGTSSIIPSMNGFFIHSPNSTTWLMDAQDPTLLVHGMQDYYKASSSPEPGHIRLRISKGICSDESIIIFNPLSSNSFDPELDALKLANGVEGAPEISTMTDENIRLCVNQLESCPVSVSIMTEHGYPDTLKFSAFDFEGLSPAVGVFLEDVRTGVWQNLREKPDYAFLNEVPGTPQRLILHFTDVTGISFPEAANEIQAIIKSNRIHLTGTYDASGIFYLLDMSGRIIRTGKIKRSIDINQVPHGAYILCLTSGKEFFRLKIIL